MTDHSLLDQTVSADARICYVLLVVIDPETGHVVGLRKRRGPEFLRGKLTFPGGKVDEGESIRQAASREMLEETGIAVRPDAWTVVNLVDEERYRLITLAATSDQVLDARQCEEEPVMPLNVNEHLDRASGQPEDYVPDFRPVLYYALETLALRHLRDARSRDPI